MKRLHLLALLGLALADTECGSSGGCPDNWRNVNGNCVLFMFYWEEERAREHCKQKQAEYRDFTISTGRSQHSLPVCLVRRETQCSCGKTLRSGIIADVIDRKIVGGDNAEKNEFPWQGKFWINL